MDDDETNIDEMAARALREFLLRCFASCATNRDWEAAELRQVVERLEQAE